MYEQTCGSGRGGRHLQSGHRRGYSLSRPGRAPTRRTRTCSPSFSPIATPTTPCSKSWTYHARRVVFGNAFLEIVSGADGKPKELWNLDATTMRVKADEHAAITGYVRYRVGYANSFGAVDFLPNEVIHFKLGTKGSTLYGLSPSCRLFFPSR